jgi:hypothetical protein
MLQAANQLAVPEVVDRGVRGPLLRTVGRREPTYFCGNCAPDWTESRAEHTNQLAYRTPTRPRNRPAIPVCAAQPIRRDLSLSDRSQSTGGKRREATDSCCPCPRRAALGRPHQPRRGRHRGQIQHKLTAVNPVTGQVTGDPDGRGKAKFTFDTDAGTVCYQLKVEGIAEPVEPAPGLGSAHIHFLATGGIAVDLEADFEADKSDEFKASGCVPVDSALLQAIVENPDQYYVNIHNAEFPGGALAGLLSG